MRPEELPPPARSPDEIRRAAEEVLARAEFQQPPKSLYDRVLDAIGDALDELISTLFSGGRSAIVAWIALAIVAGVILLLLTRILTSMRATSAVDDGMAIAVEPRRPAVDWEREADAHAAAGRWRDAVRCRYRALVARLAARGIVEEVPGRTAGDYRRELRSRRPGAAPAFGDVTDMFERAWYGHRPTGRDEHTELEALARDVLDEAAR